MPKKRQKERVQESAFTSNEWPTWSPSDQLVRQVAVICWVQQLMRKAGATTAYQTQRNLRPGSVHKQDDGTYQRNNRFERYALQFRFPRATTAKAIDLESAHWPFHILWRVLAFSDSMDAWTRWVYPRLTRSAQEDWREVSHSPDSVSAFVWCTRLKRYSLLDAVTLLLGALLNHEHNRALATQAVGSLIFRLFEEQDALAPPKTISREPRDGANRWLKWMEDEEKDLRVIYDYPALIFEAVRHRLLHRICEPRNLAAYDFRVAYRARAAVATLQFHARRVLAAQPLFLPSELWLAIPPCAVKGVQEFKLSTDGYFVRLERAGEPADEPHLLNNMFVLGPDKQGSICFVGRDSSLETKLTAL